MEKRDLMNDTKYLLDLADRLLAKGGLDEYDNDRIRSVAAELNAAHRMAFNARDDASRLRYPDTAGR